MLHPEFPRAAGTRALACSALFAALAAALVPLAPGTAHADDAWYIQKALRISTAGLDPASPADAEVLYARIRAAARRVCDDGRAFDGDCRQRAIAGAVQVLDQPLVTRLHLRRSGAAPDRTGA